MALIDRALWHIEMKREERLSLDTLAAACGVSPYHLARAFRTATGVSPMSYVRARRLTEAAKALARGDEVLGTALEAGYSSHEAFTRAFAACFGVLPRSVRASGTVDGLALMEALEMEKSKLVDVAAPEIRERASFRVVGMSGWFTYEENSGIPGLWQQLNAREDEIGAVEGAKGYGVCCDGDESGRFRYVAGIEAGADAEVPEGMDAVTVPTGRYAVFTHKGHISDLPKTVYTVWNKALPDTGLEPRRAADFEVYGPEFDVKSGRGAVEIWIPVE